jgi:hypothetical protein
VRVPSPSSRPLARTRGHTPQPYTTNTTVNIYIQQYARGFDNLRISHEPYVHDRICSTLPTHVKYIRQGCRTSGLSAFGWVRRPSPCQIAYSYVKATLWKGAVTAHGKPRDQVPVKVSTIMPTCCGGMKSPSASSQPPTPPLSLSACMPSPLSPLDCTGASRVLRFVPGRAADA